MQRISTGFITGFLAAVFIITAGIAYDADFNAQFVAMMANHDTATATALTRFFMNAWIFVTLAYWALHFISYGFGVAQKRAYFAEAGKRSAVRELGAA